MADPEEKYAQFLMNRLDQEVNNTTNQAWKREHQRLKDDITTYSYRQNGVYRGINWLMIRHRSSRHWCGYLDYNGKLTEEQNKGLEQAAHGGLTAKLGFDCGHYMDYCLGLGFMGDDQVYRDYHYVLDCLERMIDVIVGPQASR